METQFVAIENLYTIDLRAMPAFCILVINFFSLGGQKLVTLHTLHTLTSKMYIYEKLLHQNGEFKDFRNELIRMKIKSRAILYTLLL